MMAFEQQAKSKVSSVGQAIDTVKQNIQQDAQEVGGAARSVLNFGYEMDHFWKTLEDLVNFDMKFSVQ